MNPRKKGRGQMGKNPRRAMVVVVTLNHRSGKKA